MCRMLIVLCLLQAGAAFAGDDAQDEYDRYVKVTASASPPSNVGLARVAQFGGGILMQTALGALGLVIGEVACGYCGFIVGPLALAPGAYLGVQLTGHLFGRRANHGDVILGAVLGLAGGVLMAVLANDVYTQLRNNNVSFQDARMAAISIAVLGAMMPTAGALIAFELSHPEVSAPPQPPLWLSAGLVPLRGGAGFSVAGRF